MASADIFFDGVVQLPRTKKVSTRTKRKTYKTDGKSQIEKWQPTSEAFELLLKNMDEDRDRAGERYEYLRLSLMRFFERRNLPDSDAAADEVINRVMRKLVEGTKLEKSVEAFALGVARLYLLELLRQLQPESLDSHANLLTSINHVASKENALLEDKEELLRLLEACLDEMPEENKNLILAYYATDQGRAKIEHRKRLAAKHGITVKTLCLRVTRIRARIEKYLKKQSALSALIFALTLCLAVAACFFKQSRDSQTFSQSINATAQNIEHKDRSTSDTKEEAAKNPKEQKTEITEIRLTNKNDGTKQSNNAKRVRIPAESRLSLVTASARAKKSYKKYLMEIEKSSKQNIWQSDDTRTLNANNLSNIIVDVPADILEKGDYTIRVNVHKRKRGVTKPLATYQIRVE